MDVWDMQLWGPWTEAALLSFHCSFLGRFGSSSLLWGWRHASWGLKADHPDLGGRWASWRGGWARRECCVWTLLLS